MNSNFPSDEGENAKVNMILLRESSWQWFSFQFNILFFWMATIFFILKRMFDYKNKSGITLVLYSVKQNLIYKNELKANLIFSNA